MKNLFLTAAAVALLAAAGHPAAAQTLALHAPTAAPAAPAASPAPQALRWAATTHRFGTIKQGVPVTATFEFTNASARPVLLTQVQGSCGCTATSYTKEPVAPGQRAVVTATYNAANPGSFNKTVTVTTNADDTPQVLSLQGVVVGQ